MATDGQGNWIVVWHSPEDINGSLGNDSDILAAWSVDNGVNWSDPVAVNSYASSDASRDSNPAIATDESGHWIVVWETNDTLGGTIGNDQDILWSKSSDGGQTWTVARPVDSAAFTDDSGDFVPDIKADGRGTWVTAWSSYESASNVLVSRSSDQGDTWSPASGLHTPPLETEGEDFLVRLDTDGAGNWIAVWESGMQLGGTIGLDQDILFSRSVDDGLTWSPPSALNRDAPGEDEFDSSPTIISGGSGTWVAAWKSENPIAGITGSDSDIHVSYSINDGAHWSPPTPLSNQFVGDTGEDTDIAIAKDGMGTWTFVWASDSDHMGAGTDFDLFLSQAQDPQLWGTEHAVNDDAASDTATDLKPRVTTDSNGTSIAVWNARGRSGNDFDIYFSRSLDAGATWATPLPLNSNAASDTGNDRNPHILTDSTGVWIAAWDSAENIGGAIGSDLDILFSRSTDDGSTWSNPLPLDPNASTDSGDDTDPVLSTDGLGYWVAAWQTVGAFGGDFDVMSGRSGDHGVSWNTTQALNTNAATDSGDDFVPWITTDRLGLWVAVWFSNHDLNGSIGTDDDILIARSTDNGGTWTYPEPLNSNAATDGAEDDDFNPHIVTDSQGNWLTVWHSEGSLQNTVGKDHDIFIARSTDDALTWTPVATLNNNADVDSGEDDNPILATDGVGRWVAVWASTDPILAAAGTDYDILVSSSEDAGVSWRDPVALEAGSIIDSANEVMPAVIALGADNWLTVYHSNRSANGSPGSDWDIYSNSALIPPIATISLDLGGDQQVATGSRVTLDRSSVVTTGNPGPLSGTITWGDGSTSPAGVSDALGTVLASHVYSAPGVYNVSVEVSSMTGTRTTDSIQITVLNDFSPTVTAVQTSPPPVKEGEQLSGRLATFEDLDPSDTHLAFIDWGDGNAEPADLDPTTMTISGEHRYAEEGVYTVRVSVRDQKGNQGSATFLATILNSAPTLPQATTFRVLTSERLDVDSVPFFDTGEADTHVAQVDWGDSTPTETLTIPSGAREFSLEHQYSVQGDYDVTVTITDDDGESGSGSYRVQVRDAFIDPPQAKFADAFDSGTAIIEWDSQPGRVYRIEYASVPDEAAWAHLGTNITATSLMTAVTDTTPKSTNRRFYRVAEVLSPTVAFFPPDNSSSLGAGDSIFINLPEPLKPGTAPTEASIIATVDSFASPRLLLISEDRRTIALQFENRLAPGAQVTVTVDSSMLLGQSGSPIDGDGDGSGGGTITGRFSVSQDLHPILLVDDDGGTETQALYEAHLESALPNQIEIWDVRRFGRPKLRDLLLHASVVWVTGQASLPALSPSEKQELIAFLDMGGALLLSSPQVLAGNYFTELNFNTGRYDQDQFVTSRLGIQPPFDPQTQLALQGNAGSPWAGLSITMKNSTLAINDRSLRYWFQTDAPSIGSIEDSTGSFPGWFIGAHRHQDGRRQHRLVFWSFDIGDVLTVTSPASDDIASLLTNSIDYFDGAPPTRWITPQPNATNTPLNTVVDLAMREPMSSPSITSAARLEDSSGTPVATTAEYFEDSKTLRLTPTFPLRGSETFTVTIDSSAETVYASNLGSRITSSFTTGTSQDTTPPAPPSPPVFVNDGSGERQITIQVGEPLPGNTLRVYRREQGTPTWAPAHSGSIVGTTFIDSEVFDGIAYEYALTSLDQCLNESSRSPSITAISHDRAPPNLAITLPEPNFGNVFRTNSNTVSIQGFVDDPDATVTVAGQQIAHTLGEWQRDNIALPSSGNNRLVISATDPHGNTTTETLTVYLDDSVQKPRGLRARPTSTSDSLVTWSDSGELDIVSYTLERRPAAGATYVAIATTIPPNREFLDDQITPGQQYCYRLRANDDFGNISPYSDEACPLSFGGPGGLGGSLGVNGGGVAPNNSTSTNIASTSVQDPTPIIESDGAARVRYLGDPDPFIRYTGTPELPGPRPLQFSGHINDRGPVDSRITMSEYMLEHLGGFGSNLNVTITLPHGFEFDNQNFAANWGVGVSIYGTYPVLGRPNRGFNPPANGHLIDWDPTRTLYDVYDDGISITNRSATSISFTVTGKSIVVDSDSNNDPIYSGPPSIKAFQVRLQNTHIKIKALGEVSSRVPVVSVNINGTSLECPIACVLDPDPYSRAPLRKIIDDRDGILNILNGDYSFVTNLFQGSGHGINVDGSLTYSSLNTTWHRDTSRLLEKELYSHISLGVGWAYPYGMRVIPWSVKVWKDGANVDFVRDLYLICPDGRITRWIYRSAEVYSEAPGWRASTPAIIHGPAPRWAQFTNPILIKNASGYLIRESDQELSGFGQIAFDSEGRMTRIVPHGGATPLEIEYQGNSQRVVDSSGRVTVFQKGATDQIERIEDPAGGIWDLDYVDDALVSIQETGTGYGWEFAYDSESGLLVERKNPNGFVIQADYNTDPGSAERFFWAALKSTKWKEDAQETDRAISYIKHHTPGGETPDRVIVSTPGKRNRTIYDLTDTNALSAASRYVNVWGDESKNVAVRESDHEEGNQNAERFIEEERSNNGYGILNAQVDALARWSVIRNAGHHIWIHTRPNGNSYIREAGGTFGSQSRFAPDREIGWRPDVVKHFRYSNGRSINERLIEAYLPGEDPNDPNAKKYTYDYDALARPSTTTDPDGNVARYIYHSSEGKRGLVAQIRPCDNRLFPGTSTERNPYKWLRDYDRLGRLTKVTDPERTTVEYRYDAAGRRTHIIGPYNPAGSLEIPETRLEYQGELVTRIQERIGGGAWISTALIYDHRSRIVEMIQPGDSQDGTLRRTQFDYDDDNNLVKTVSPIGGVTTYTFDNRNQVIRRVGPEGETEEFDYNEAGEIEESRKIDGASIRRTTIADRDRLGRPLEILLPTVTQAAGTGRPTIRYRYDAHQNIREESYSFLGAERKTEYFYDLNDALFRQSTSMGGGQVFNLAFVRDHLGRVIQEQGPHLDPPNVAGTVKLQPNRQFPTVTSYSYDCFGNVEKVSDLSGDERARMKYDLSSRLIEYLIPDPSKRHTQSGNTQALTSGMQRKLDPFGLATELRDSLGNSSTFERDATGRVISETDPAGHQTRSEHSPSGQVTTASVDTDGEPAVTSADFDEGGNPLRVDAPGNDADGTTFEYDDSGRLTTTTAPDGGVSRLEYNKFGEVIEESHANGARIVHARDGLGRITSSTYYDATGNVALTETSEHDVFGRLRAVEDDHTRTEYTLDNIDRLLEKKTTYKLGGGQTDFTHWVRYGWGEYGNLVSMEDSLGHATRYTWDNEDNLVRVVHDHPTAPDLAMEPTFDAVGALTGWKCVNGNTEAFSVGILRDQKGRISQFSYLRNPGAASSSPPLPSVSYQYDSRDMLIEARYDDRDLIVSYDYDAVGQLTGETWRRGSDNGVVHEEKNYYDVAGNRVRRERNGLVTTYDYGTDGVLLAQLGQSLVCISGSLLQVSADSEFGPGFEADLAIDGLQPDSDESGTGWRSAATDTDHWLEIDLGVQRAIHAIDVSVPTFRGGIDQLIIERKDGVNQPFVLAEPSITIQGRRAEGGAVATDAHTVRLVFSAPITTRCLRLSIPKGGTGRNDISGQRLPDVVINEVCLYVAQQTQVTYDYDDSGRLISDGTHTYDYDVLGHLVGVRGPGVDKSWTIGPDGTRQSETDNLTGKTLYFLNDGGNTLVEFELNGTTPEVKTKHFSGLDLDAQIGFTEYVPGGGFQNRWTIREGPGSVTQVLDGSGETLDSSLLNAWGEDVLTPTKTTSNQFGFAGLRMDRETGLLYARARMYDPSCGRFTTPDPLGMIEAPNLYPYAGNNPIMYRDPTGMFYDSPGQAAEELSGVADVKTAFRGASAEWEYGSKPLAALYAAGGTIIAVDAAANAVPLVGQAKAVLFSGIKVGLKRIFVRGGREVLVEGVETATRRAAGRTAVQAGTALERSIVKRAQALDSVREKYRLLRQNGITRQRSRALMESGSVCFVAGTLVETKNGPIPIEDISPGMKVRSLNPDSGDLDLKQVTQVFEGRSEEFIEILVHPESSPHQPKSETGRSDSSSAADRPVPITSTLDHPYWVLQRGWIRARSLSIGDILLTVSGTRAVVQDTRRISEVKQHFNLEVADWHTYFVSAAPDGSTILVHNRCPATDGWWSGKKGESTWHSYSSDVGGVTMGRGVEFRNGMPDFSPWSHGKAELPQVGKGGRRPFANHGTTGNGDFTLADAELGRQLGVPQKDIATFRKELNLTWHHHQNGTSMELVPQALHNNVPHTGGVSTTGGTGRTNWGEILGQLGITSPHPNVVFEDMLRLMTR